VWPGLLLRLTTSPAETVSTAPAASVGREVAGEKCESPESRCGDVESPAHERREESHGDSIEVRQRRVGFLIPKAENEEEQKNAADEVQ